jgi:hypothetical protein
LYGQAGADWQFAATTDLVSGPEQGEVVTWLTT